VFNGDSLPGVFKMLFEDLGYFGGLGFNFACFRVLRGGLPVAVHFYLQILLCVLCVFSLVLYLSAAAAFNEQYCCLFCCVGHLYW